MIEFYGCHDIVVTGVDFTQIIQRAPIVIGPEWSHSVLDHDTVVTIGKMQDVVVMDESDL